MTGRLGLLTGAFLFDFQSPADPAVGANFTRSVPGDRFEQLLGVRFRLGTSAVAGTRALEWVVADPDNNEFVNVLDPSGIVASSSRVDCFVVDVGAISGVLSSRNTVPIPRLWLPPGWRWRIVVDGGDAGDALTLIRFLTYYVPNDELALGIVSSFNRQYLPAETAEALAGRG